MDNPVLHRWVKAENALTEAYPAEIPVREWIKRWLTELWNYAKESTPVQVAGPSIFFLRNAGLQNQSVLYVQDSPSSESRILIDPNKLSPNGSIALVDFEPSPDGQYLSYALSQGGSDWETIHVLNVSTGRTLSDVVHWVKFSNIAWTHGDNGFFYSRYPTPAQDNRINQRVVDQQLYFHTLGDLQTKDRLIYSRPDLPHWIIEHHVTENGQYLFVALHQGTAHRPRGAGHAAIPGLLRRALGSGLRPLEQR